MDSSDIQETKLKILKSAEVLFAEKGFDGARVDDIARKAGVNKALIYYYFDSKRDILDEIVKSLIDDINKMAYNLIERIVDFNSMEYRDDEMSKMMEYFYNFMEQRKNIIKIIMMESLKESEDQPPLFRLSEITMSDEAEMLKENLKSKGIDVDNIDMDQQFIADFFTGLMPLFSFIVYRDKWSKYFNIEPEELKKTFFEIFQITHLAYHKYQLKNIQQKK